MEEEITKQKIAFMDGEGDAWYERNKQHIDDILTGKKSDPVVEAIKLLEIVPKSVLEVGCSNGYRLNILHDLFECRCEGIDPSFVAVDDSQGRRFPVTINVGTADNLCFGNAEFDMVIFGFCLYLCDREDLFKICYEADRVLKPGGRIVIYDFYSKREYSNEYRHLPGVRSFKMDYKELFLVNPFYSLEFFRRYGDAPDDWTAVNVLRKSEMEKREHE